MTSAHDHPARHRFPILQGVLPITTAQIPTEILAGITLAAIAVPEVMGYTKIAGTPLITGLYTMLIPTALFALFGSSRHLVVGADSATAAILASAMVGIAATGSEQYMALAGVLALMAAGFLILARLMRLGFLADFLSRTVLIGFLTGVGVQVALGEIAGMLGLKGGGHGALGKFWNDLQQLGQANRYEMTVALSVLVVIVGLKMVSKKIPGALIAAIGALVVTWAFGLDKQVHIVGAVPSGLPHLGLPKVDWNWTVMATLLPTAFAMFVVILAQSAATARAFATRYDETFSENTDLVGLALANIGAGLSGTFVVNGSPTKTQIVDDAGGRSQLSLLVMSAMVALILLFLTGALTYLPEAALSAIVFLIGVGLIDIAGMRRVFDQRRTEFWLALITALTVVIVGVEQGILLAIALSLIESHPVRVSTEERGASAERLRRLAAGAGGQGCFGCTGVGNLPIHPQHVLRELPAARGGDFISRGHRGAAFALALHRCVRCGRCRLFRGGDHPVGVREVEGERNTAGRYGNHG